MNLDLSGLLSQVNDFANQTSQNIIGIQNDSKTISDLSAQQVQDDKDTAAAAQTKAGIDSAENARQEAARQALVARYGLDPTKAGDLFSRSAQTMQEADANLNQLANTIGDKQSINFIENPLGWIGAKMTVGGDIANYNRWATVRNNAENAVQSATKIVSDGFQVTNANSATATAVMAQAQSVLAAHTYNQQAYQAGIQGARFNLEGIQAVSQMSQARLGSLFQANSAQMQEKQYNAELTRINLQTQSLDLQKQEFGLKKEEFKFQQGKYDESKMEDSMTLKFIKQGFSNLNNGAQIDDMRAKEAFIMLKKNDPNARSLYESGMQSYAVTGSADVAKPVINLSPYKVSTLVGGNKVTGMSPSQAQVGEQLVTWRREFENRPVMDPTKDPYAYDKKDVNSKEIAFNTFVADKVKTIQGAVPQGSIFSPMDPSAVAKLDPKVGNSPTWKNVLEPLSKSGADLTDPNVVMGGVLNAMAAGKLSYIDAVADTSTMYQSAVEHNNQTRNFMSMGIPSLNRSYKTDVRVPGYIGKVSVNLADPTAVATLMNKVEAARFTKTIGAEKSRGDAGVSGDVFNLTK